MKFPSPTFFDIFGVLTFGFIIIFSLWMIKTGQLPPRWSIVFLLIIGVGGLIIDGTIVYKTYIK